MSHAMLLGGSEILRVCDSAQFDGTNDYQTRGADLTGNADSKTGIFSFWTRIDGGDGTQREIINSEAATRHFAVYIDAFNKFGILGREVTTNNIGLLIASTTAYTAGATWRHLLASWDLTDVNKQHLYVTDVSDLTTTSYVNLTIDYAGGSNYSIGATTAGTNKYNGCMAELYFAPGQYLDFSLVANRRKFISSSGKPVHLGTDGSLPTGTAPLVYHHLDDGEAVANFATNRGTGGNFSITGTLDTGSSSPSD